MQLYNKTTNSHVPLWVSKMYSQVMNFCLHVHDHEQNY